MVLKGGLHHCSIFSNGGAPTEKGGYQGCIRVWRPRHTQYLPAMETLVQQPPISPSDTSNLMATGWICDIDGPIHLSLQDGTNDFECFKDSADVDRS